MRPWTGAFVTALALLAFAPASEAAIVGMFANGELTVEDLDGQANNLAVSLEGNDYVIRDSKTNLEINGGSLFDCTFPDEPDHHKVSCTRPAGSKAKLQTLNAGGGADDVTVDDQIDIQDMFGGGGNDKLRGGAKADRIVGDAGDDTVTGGKGKDRLYGNAGDDTLQARDGVKDGLITCGEGKDVAVIDKNDPNPIDCENVKRGDFGGQDDGGGGGGDTGVESTSVTVTVPDVRPKVGKRGYDFHTVDQLTAKLQKLGVPYLIKKKGVSFASINKVLRRRVEDGDITKQQGPRPGRKITVDPACRKGTQLPCRLTITVKYFDESTELEGRKCFYDVKKRDTEFFLALFKDANYGDALQLLEQFNCDYRVVLWIETKDAKEFQVRGANVSRNRTREATSRFYISLVVERPRRSDFTLSVTGRPRSDYERSPANQDDFDKEIDLGADGKLTAGRAPGVVTVVVNENWTGRFVRRIRLEAVKEDGTILASTETDRRGDVTFTLPLDWTGELEINARVSLEGGQEMAGWITIPVVDRKQKPFFTQSGRYFTFVNGRYVRTPSRDELVALMNGIAGMLRNAVPRFGNLGAACRAALASNARAQDQVRTCWEQDGIQATQFSSGGKTDASLNVAQIKKLPGFVTDRGKLKEATLGSVVIPGKGAVTGASLIGQDGGSLVPNPKALISVDANDLIGNDGGSIVSDYSGGLTPPALAGLVTIMEGQKLIGQDGGSFISANGGKLLASNGSKFISENGGAALPLGPIRG